MKKFYGLLFVFAGIAFLAYLYKKGAVKIPGLPDVSPSNNQSLITDSPLAGSATPSSLSPVGGAPIPGIVSSPSYRTPVVPPVGRPNYYTP